MNTNKIPGGISPPALEKAQSLNEWSEKEELNLLLCHPKISYEHAKKIKFGTKVN